VRNVWNVDGGSWGQLRSVIQEHQQNREISDALNEGSRVGRRASGLEIDDDFEVLCTEASAV
jgi:hypothetical protein